MMMMQLATASRPASACRCIRGAPSCSRRIPARRGAQRWQPAHTATTRCPAAAGNKEIYQGVYGPWSVEAEDEREVWGYRAGLSVTAAAWLLATALVLGEQQSDSLQGLIQLLLNPLCLVGAAGFATSLVLIHIYVDSLKKTLQAFAALGVAGGVYLALTQAEPVPLFVVHHNWAVWLVGPFFAAVTGLAFKEGVCYGKPEAALLFFLLPLSLLSHLSGLVPGGASQALFLTSLAAFCVLAGRKYTQAVKDDIGDKSVFMFRQLPEAEQQAVVARLQLRQAPPRSRDE